MEICIIRKNQKIHSNKTVSQLTIEQNFFCFLSHDRIQRLNCGVHYLNMKMKEKSVEIIDIQLCSSLKLDGM